MSSKVIWTLKLEKQELLPQFSATFEVLLFDVLELVAVDIYAADFSRAMAQVKS